MDPLASDNLDPLAGYGIPSLEVLLLLLLGLAVLGAVVVNRQITVRRLRQSEQAFRDLYDNIGEGVFRSTLDGSLVIGPPCTTPSWLR